MKYRPFLFLSLVLTIGGAFLTGCTTGLSTVTATNFTSIASWTGSFNEVISSVYSEGTNVYAAAGSDGLYVFDSDLTYLTKFNTNVYPIRDVAVKTFGSVKYAYVANGMYNGKGGVMMIQVGDLTNLYVTNSCEYNGLNPNALAVNDNNTNIYTADQFFGFQPYTNSWDAASVTNAGISFGTSPGADIAFSGSKAYVAAKTGGVFIINTTLNVIAAQISTTLLMANAVAVTGSGDGTLLAVADSLGLIIYALDDPDPAHPRYLGGYYCGTVYDVVVNGNDFYLALGTAGVYKVTRTPPASFTLVKKVSDGTAYYKLYYNSSTGYVYAACGKDGIRILQ